MVCLFYTILLIALLNKAKLWLKLFRLYSLEGILWVTLRKPFQEPIDKHQTNEISMLFTISLFLGTINIKSVIIINKKWSKNQNVGV